MEAVRWVGRVRERFCALPLWQKVALALGYGLFIGLLEQVKFYIPTTPVPIVLGTVGVCGAGVLMGSLWGTLSVLFFLLFGAAGLPVFAGGARGISALLGPTGGYLVGFVLAAWFCGKFFTPDSPLGRAFLTFVLAHWIVIYLPGLLVLGFWMKVTGSWGGILHLLYAGAVPFLLGDGIKSLALAFVLRGCRG